MHTDREARQQIIQIVNELFGTGHLTATGGNVSHKSSDGETIWITPATAASIRGCFEFAFDRSPVLAALVLALYAMVFLRDARGLGQRAAPADPTFGPRAKTMPWRAASLSWLPVSARSFLLASKP